MINESDFSGTNCLLFTLLGVGKDTWKVEEGHPRQKCLRTGANRGRPSLLPFVVTKQIFTSWVNCAGKDRKSLISTCIFLQSVRISHALPRYASGRDLDRYIVFISDLWYKGKLQILTDDAVSYGLLDVTIPQAPPSSTWLKGLQNRYLLGEFQYPKMENCRCPRN